MLCWVMYIMWFRLFHVDDIPSGVGGDTLDFNKATEVGWCIMLGLLSLSGSLLQYNSIIVCIEPSSEHAEVEIVETLQMFYGKMMHF